MFTGTLPILLLLIGFGYGAKEKPVFSEEIQEIIQSVHDDCVAQTGVSEEDIANCEKGIFKQDTKLKCYMFCLLEEAALVDEDENVDYDMFFSFIPEAYVERTTKMINACRHFDTKTTDKCTRAFNVHKCSYGIDPDFYFLF